ncbi:glycine--tRNA ligase subunit alpha, partial [Francisella tularensis]|uniref:glycine--tRNA ligase subunit alpha n=1 Tax=Francisella tularensis TaxID=263 RepID=UPI002381CF3B
EELFKQFDLLEKEVYRFVEKYLPIPAFEFVLKASHTFNLLDARHAISVTERQVYILRVRKLALEVSKDYYSAIEKSG